MEASLVVTPYLTHAQSLTYHLTPRHLPLLLGSGDSRYHVTLFFYHLFSGGYHFLSNFRKTLYTLDPVLLGGPRRIVRVVTPAVASCITSNPETRRSYGKSHESDGIFWGIFNNMGESGRANDHITRAYYVFFHCISYIYVRYNTTETR